MSDADWDDDRPLEDWEYPDGDDAEQPDSTPVRDCPKCGADVYDDAICCPICGEYFTREGQSSPLPVWMKVAAIAAVVGMLVALRYCL